MAKNKDGKSFNRTGRYNHNEGTITFEDNKGNVTVFNLVGKLAEYDGEEISVTVTTDMNPSHLAGDGDIGE